MTPPPPLHPESLRPLKGAFRPDFPMFATAHVAPFALAFLPFALFWTFSPP